MNRHVQRGIVASAAAVLLLPAIAPAASAAASGPSAPHGTGRPVVEHVRYTDYLPLDDFFLDLCGISTGTRIAELDILTTYPDGTQRFHVERSFVPDDPRLPIERGAATAYYASADGPMTRMSGKPIQLLMPGGGVRALDAGLQIFGDPYVSHGHVDVGIDNPDLASFYCPS
jgi:hypothetical protein